MDRLIDPLNELFESRFLVLYGKGIEDAYISSQYKELSVESAILQHLKQMGWRRIIFIYPDKPFKFFDDESRHLSETVLLDNSSGSPQDFIGDLQPGPYGNRIIVPNSTPKINFEGFSIGDTHAIRLLDTIMRDHTGPTTALIFIQAEGFMTNFQDHRTLSGVLSSWIRLPTYNQNRCIFTISSNDYAELIEVAKQLPIPEIRSLILNRGSTRNKQSSTRSLSGPFADECEFLLESLSRNQITRINPSSILQLADKLAAEDVQLKSWYARFQKVDTINFDVIRDHGWFTSFNGDTRPVQERLNQLVGLGEVKTRINELAGWISVRKRNTKATPVNLHMIFTGNPGTGKTSVARLIGELFHELGILKRGHLIEAKAVDLVAEHVGGTNIKTNQLIDQAIDGVLFIDEAYSLSSSERGGFGAEAIETLLTRMEDERDRLVVILAGYQTQLNQLIRSNPGLSRRFPEENRFHFNDFSQDELLRILNIQLAERQLDLSREIAQILPEVIGNMVAAHQQNFGNAGEMRNLADSLERKCLSRIHMEGNNARPILRLSDLSNQYKEFSQKALPDVDKLLKELDDLVGLDDVKAFVRRQLARVQFDQMRINNKKNGTRENHPSNLIFVGNPGTGKTTVARLIGRIFYALGILRKGHLVEVSMPDLISGYVGQTTAKVMEKKTEALDGVLFIDEAYALIRNTSLITASYGQEAIDTLVKAIEDNKYRLIVIMAGYPHEMGILIKSNPGLKSRFSPPILFRDFTPKEMHELLQIKLDQDDLKMPDLVKEEFINNLEIKREEDPSSFGNARDLLAYYEQAKDRLALRIMRQIESSGKKKAGLPVYAEIFVMEDIVDEGYTIVVGSPDEGQSKTNKRLKSWVIPNR